MLRVIGTQLRRSGLSIALAGITIIGLICFNVFSSTAYPRTHVSVTASNAARIASTFAKQFGLIFYEPGRPTTSSDQTAASWVTFVGISDIDTVKLPIFTWIVADLHSSCQIAVMTNGDISSIECDQDSASELSAQSLMEWARAHGAPKSLTEADISRVIVNPDTEVRWSTVTTDASDVTIDYVFANNGSTVSLAQAIRIPDSDRSAIQRSAFLGEIASTLGFIVSLIFVVLAAGTVLRSSHSRGSSVLTGLTAVLAVLVIFSAANNISGTTATPPAGISLRTYQAALLLSNGFAAVILFVTVKLCGEAALRIPKLPEAFPATASRRTSRSVLKAIAFGTCLACVWLGASTAGYAMTNSHGLTSVRLSPPDVFSLATVVPILTPFAASLIASFQEEVLFRWFAFRRLAAMTRSRCVAGFLTSLAWALIHANYGVIPSLSRVVELLLLGALLVVVSQRYGILAAITAHYAIDYVTISAPIARAWPAHVIVVLIALFIVPLLAFVHPRLSALFSPPIPAYPHEEDGEHSCPDNILTSRISIPSSTPRISANAIEVRTLVKRFEGTEVLNDVTLNVRYNAVTCLLGPNGAGKTTLMRILVGHESLSSGTARIALADTGTVSGRTVGYVPDSSLVYPLLTVREHLRLVAAVYGLVRFTSAQEDRFLVGLGLNEHADLLASKLSKGLKKRLMLACAVRQGAQVLILDEPFDGLDPDGQAFLMSLVEQLRDQGRCVLVSTHHLDIAERVADDLLVLSHGQLVFSGTPAQFMCLGEASGGKTAFEAAFAAVNDRGDSGPELDEFKGVLP